jgi:magnesium transporter
MADGEAPTLQQLLEDEGIGPDRLREMLEMVHPVDLAEDLDDLDLQDRVRVFETLSPAHAAHVLEAMPHEARVKLIDAIGEERLSAVIDAMSADVVADVIDHLPAHKEQRLLEKIDAEHRQDIRELQKHPPNTAGGRMTKNFVAVPEDFTAGQVMKALQGAVTVDTVPNLYITDPDGRLVGVCGLGSLLRHPPEAPVADFMRRDLRFVGPSLDQEEVARMARRYNLRAVPVVEADMRLVGVVTLDNLLDVVHEEANEDVMKLAGVEHTHPLHAPFLQRLKARMPWLAAAMALELVIAWIMKGYGHTLEKMALAYFIPVIMAMGGSVGLQSATLVVRGLATGELNVGRGMRVVLAELRVGFVIGLLAGLVTGVMALVMEMRNAEAVQLGLIVLASMTLSIAIAATFGAVTPLVLHRLKVDPAVASGPFITAVNDVVNVTIYLTIATLLIVQTR